MESQFCDKYLETTDAAFELYAKTLDPLNEYFSRQSPIETQVFPEPGIADSRVPWPELTEKGQRAAKRAYAQSIRAQSFDVARVLLPASALTNLGLSGNSRALSTLMIKLHANELSEAQMLGVEGTEQLRKTLLPNFWVDIDNHHGQAAMEAQNGQSQVLKRIALEAFKNKRPEDVNLVNLIDLSSFDETTLAAAGSLYSFTNLPLLQVAAEIRENPDLENIILNEALNFRTNRRHKPPRGFELTNGGVTFEYLADFGIFRDLQRHRILTLLHQPYTTEHGYDVSPILEDVGMEGEVRDLFDRVGELHCDMRKELPNESQYMTLLGHNMRWIYATNLRQLFWLTELRSTPQAHPKYRRVAQEMYAQTVEKYPFMAELNSQQSYVMQDSNDNNLVRLDAASKSEARNEE